MSNTLTIRLPKELSEWLTASSRRIGVPRGQLIRMELERAQRQASEKPFMKLAGILDGPGDLSTRKGLMGQKRPGRGIQPVRKTSSR